MDGEYDDLPVARLLEGGEDRLPIVGARGFDWALITYLGVIQIGVAYWLVMRGLRGVPAVEASLLMMIEPALNPVWVWLIQGEAPGQVALLGGAIILASSFGRAMAEKAARAA